MPLQIEVFVVIAQVVIARLSHVVFYHLSPTPLLTVDPGAKPFA
jgi:hypothetical protein